MKRTRKERGITLVALIITIIVLLILAVVSIRAVTGDGIIQYAKNSRTDYTEAQTNEKYALSQLEEFLTENQTGVIVEQVTDTAPGVLEGEGTESTPYVINSIEDLVFFAYDVKGGNTYESKYVTLGTSLDFNSTKSYVEAYRTDYGEYGYNGELKTLLTSGEGYHPIGTTSNIDMQLYSFAGEFNGNNKTISNLYINKNKPADEQMRIGLFGGNYGTIKNVQVLNGKISLTTTGSTGDIGGITSKNYGTVEDCSYIGDINMYVTGTLTGGFRVGGIVTGNESGGIIRRCYHNGLIYVENNSDVTENKGTIGGISVGNSGQIYECYSIGKIQSKNVYEIGGIVAYNEGEVNNCYNLKDIAAENGLYLGGVIGEGHKTKSTITNCYSIGDLTLATYRGGIAGNAKGTINNCYFFSKTSGNYNNPHSNDYSNSIIEKTEEEMKLEGFVELLNQDNEGMWKQDTNNVNNGYPILSWQ